ncbi:MAG: heavy-metal-associated domain-containing protein [Prolixibacteraceae bacterium]
MKKLALLLMMTMIAGFASDMSAREKGREEVYFKSDMDCGQCEKDLYEHLRFEKGIKDLKVDHVSNTIFIEYKTNKSNDESFAEAIEEKGFKAEKITQEEYKKIVAQTE